MLSALWFRYPLLAVLVSGLAGPGLAAEPLSLDRALSLAQQHSRLLDAQDAAASAARAMSAAAAQRPDPVLRAGINNWPVDGADRLSLTRDFMTMRSLGLMQEFTREDKRRMRAARFDREADAAQAARLVALAGLRRDTAMAWLERHYAERLRELLQAQRTESALQVEAAEAAYRGQRGSQADVFAARAAVAQIDDRVQQSEQQVGSANTRLARWIGRAAAEAALAGAPDLAKSHLDGPEFVRQLEQTDPELQLLLRQEAVATADVDVARSARTPDWSVELMFSQRGSAYSNMVSLNVSVPLQWDRPQRQDREVAAKAALAEQARAQREEATRDRLAQIRSWQLQWRSGLARLAHYDAAVLPLASERTRAALAAYRGAGALSSVLEARRMEIEQRIERLRIEMETAAAWARLDHLIPPEPAQESAR